LKSSRRINRVPRSLLAKLGLTGKPANRDAVFNRFRRRMRKDGYVST
jgi:hypothetical protein